MEDPITIAFNVAANIITKLVELGVRELGSIRGVDDKLEELKRTVSTIEAVLLDAEEKQFKSRAEKDWLSRLKDVFYDVDDLIDEFSYETLRRQVMIKHRTKTKKVRIFLSTSNQIAFGHKMSHKIKDVREKLGSLVRDKIQLHPLGNECAFMRDRQHNELRERRYTHSFIPDKEVIGRDDDRKAIINLLLDTNNKKDVSIIAIVGIGGLGKTTLVQSVFNDENIRRHFELKLWVCISEVFDVTSIVEKLIESATNKRPKSSELDVLQRKLRDEIEEKKYLLILDDVWNVDHEKWVSLKRLLMGGAKGSKIVITTRIQRVATTCHATTYPLECLSEHNSWLLFKHMAFQEGEKIKNMNLIKIGREIAAKLKGVPLAIRFIGRLLYDKRSEVEWLNFKDNELNTVMQEENGIQSILKLSYNDLPYNLKRCFTYCALFPKDYEIKKNEVIKQWVAQGFVQPLENKPIEDVSDDYFKELSWRLFFQEIRKNKWGDIGCKMHDFMHDLACSIEITTRHVLFDFDPNKSLELPESLFQEKNLRTCMLRYHHRDRSSDDDNLLLKRVFSTFLRLRTLNLNIHWITELPNSISKLKHLRYLDLSHNTVMELLPNSITELYNLETLILNGCKRLRELPRDTANLISLRHLDMKDCCHLTHMPKGMRVLTRLQTMNLFVLGAKDDDNGLSELKELNNLKGLLTIRGLKFCRTVDLHINANYLNLKSDLQKLELDWTRNYYEKNPKREIDAVDDNERVLECLQPHSNVRKIHVSQYQGLKVSNWLSHNSLNRLVTIRLSSCERLQRLPRFDQFSSLKHLVLQSLTSIDYIDDGNDSLYSSIFFPSLAKLSIHNMPKLKRWWKSEKSSLQFFPCLFKLEIVGCCELTSIPLLPPLGSLKLDGVPMRLLESMVMETTINLAAESSSSMSILNSLCLSRIQDLEFLPHEFFYHLEILEFLFIQDCKNLQMSFSHVDENDSGAPWWKLASLRSLTFDGILKLECLPKGLQYVTALRFFRLQNCPNLTSLPEWIGNLTSLEILIIHDCPKLASLPEGIRHLTLLSRLNICNCCNLASLPKAIFNLHSLQSLIIDKCPKLPERYKEEIVKFNRRKNHLISSKSDQSRACLKGWNDCESWQSSCS